VRNLRSTSDLILEKIPPLVTWALILFPIWGGFIYPNGAAYIILTLNIYFLYRSISITILLLIAVVKLRESESINWLNRLYEIDNISGAIQNLKAEKLLIQSGSKIVESTEFKNESLNKVIKNRVPLFLLNLISKIEKGKAIKFINQEIKRLEYLQKFGIVYDWKNIRHVIIIPHWKEPFHILKETIERIRQTNYPTHNISIVLAAEARDPEGIAFSELLKKEYEQYFDNIWINKHELKSNELVGKSSNMRSASTYAYQQIMKLNWDLKLTTVTSCDADSQLPEDYFSNTTYLYVTTKDSEYKYFTGAVLLHANIWKLPFFARVKNSMSSLYNLTRLMREDKLIPFSTYTLSFWLIKEIDFWTPNITPEDYHTFFKGLFMFPNKTSTVPIFQRIMADAAEGDNALDTARNNYLQERRWAWGVSDDGWMIKNLLIKTFTGKATIRMIYIVLHALWDHMSIGISVLVTFGSNLIVLVNPRFSYTVVGANLPAISSFLIQLTLLFFVFTVLLDSYIKPQPKGKKNLIQKFFGFFEWFLQPFVGTILVVLPGIEAHTRLLFGKYLEYYLTKKK